ncbi:Putative 60s ribosomal protein l19 [[Torrubiella] hemipterigena]|uniref:Putative 60s ribosomal protein l19 n=1 Tax=[Torrubiella] hemipterigena TaxID=1531966 RepID=A0A0A1TFP6_9HYPO|nr:Putative 60s ribosomal protein l19 [[Torrubiella] hemipterigena]
MTATINQIGDYTMSKALQFGQWLATPTGRGVLKCTIAYTIASLATFASPLSAFFGKPDGKHVVATITVYFHASRSAGSMIEATLIAIVAVAYAEAVSILSMATSVLFGSVLGLVTLAYVLVVLVFIGGGFGFMAWVKQRMGNPLVNVASTLASLAIIGVVTKENAVISNVFSNQKIVQVFKMLLMGIASAAAVNLLLWRVSARALLRQSLSTASISLAKTLSVITASFLIGAQDDLADKELSTASSVYSTTYKQVTKNLREAMFEHYFVGRDNVYAVERSSAIAIATLAQSVGGLRSAATSQIALLHQISANIRRPSQGAAVDESEVLDSAPSSNSRKGKHRLNTPLDAFDLFVSMIKPHMESLAESLVKVLSEPPFGEAPSYTVTVNNELRWQLTNRLSSFNLARADALEQLYQLMEQNKEISRSAQAEFEEIAAACGHFSFSLQSLGEEMQKYLDVIEDLRDVTHLKQRSWYWLMWWRKDTSRGISTMPYETPETETLHNPAPPKAISESIRERRDTYSWDAAPNASRVVSTVSQYILRLARKMAQDDIRFGIKVGIGASLWAMLAFIEGTRDWYNHYRGEWGLLSFMIVCSMTVGASNTTGWSRFVGTFLGAAFSIVNWTISQGNAVVLVILGFMVSYFNFYLIVARGKAPLGRMTLLAYNVSTLYAYSLSQKVDEGDNDEGGTHPVIMEIVKHRVMSVMAGIIWGLVVCRVIWPISARRKFKQGISTLYLQMGLIWKRGPLAILLRSDCTQNYLKSGELADMQLDADRLESLRQSAASEFELRGPFPFDASGSIMRSTNRILDGFYAMSLVTQLKGNLTPGERALLQYTATERAVLCDRICHIFQVLASSIMLEYPLTDAVPSIVNARDRLLSKIFQFRSARLADNTHGRSEAETSQGNMRRGSSTVGGDDLIDDTLLEIKVEERDYALLYAYALVTGQVADELTLAEKEMQGLFGVLSS